MRKAKTAVMKALEIDNTLGEAHAELAWIQFSMIGTGLEVKRDLNVPLN